MLARLRGVARRHVAMGLKFVNISLVVAAADGLINQHIDTHGLEGVLPHSTEAMQTAEIMAILRLPTGTRVGPFVVGDNIEWQGVVVMICLFATMGCRMEAIALGSGEAMLIGRKLHLWHLTYRVPPGELVRAPSVAQLLAATWGFIAYITPCACKNDPKGDKYVNSVVPSKWHPTRPICFAREVVKYELMRAVRPERRRCEPLVLGPSGRPWAKAALHTWFKTALLPLVCVPERVRLLSMHSFRVWLACALLAAGATPEQIMTILRWSSDSARRLYAQMGAGSQTALTEAAADVPLDTVRAHSLLEAAAGSASSREADAAMRDDATGRAAHAVRDALELVARAHDFTGVLPSPREAPVVDDDALFVRLDEARPELARAAEQYDAQLDAGGVSDADSEDSDGEGGPALRPARPSSARV